MIERVLFQIIKEGLAVLTSTPGLIASVFINDGVLSVAEAEKVEALVVAAPPDVVHGYARADNKFPLYAITLGGENESQRFVGDDGGYDPDEQEDIFAAAFTLTFNLMIYAQHPDTVLYLYRLLKYLVISGFPILKGDPTFAYDLSWSGADLAPDPAWPPGLFVRRATLVCSQQYQQALSSSTVPDARINRVTGIHVDGGAPGTDNGGVLAQVYPRSEEED